jgi:hypothetical protein
MNPFVTHARTHVFHRRTYSAVLGGNLLLNARHQTFTAMQEHWCAVIVVGLVATIVIRALRNQLGRVQAPPALTAEQIFAREEQMRQARARLQAQVAI